MLRKKTPSIIKKISRKSLLANRSRNLVSAAAIIMTATMFTALFTLGLSQMESTNMMYMREVGTTAHATLKGVSEEQKAKISQNDLVRKSGSSTVVGLAENEAFPTLYVEIRHSDEEYRDMGFDSIEAGEYPVEQNEIAADARILEAMGIEVRTGVPITLRWKDDYSKEIYSEQEFTVTGYWHGSEMTKNTSVWVSEAFINAYYADKDVEVLSQNDYSLYTNHMRIMLGNANQIEEEVEQLLSGAGMEGISYGINWAYETEIRGMALMDALPIFAMMLLVFLSGYLIIYNIFQMSVSADIRFYGMLRTLGVTKRFQKAIVYRQVFLLSLIGIPIGLLLGYAVGVLLLPMIITSSAKSSQQISMSPVIFIGAAAVTFVTVFLSCIKPAGKAQKITPMEALRYVGEELSKVQKKGTSGAKIGRMAFSNVGRNKRRSFIIICSISLGMVLLSCVYAVNASFDTDKYIQLKISSDFVVKDSGNLTDPAENQITDSVQEDIKQIPGITEMGILYYGAAVTSLTDDAYRDIVNFYEENDGERYDWFSWNTKWIDTYAQMKETKECPLLLMGIDEILEDTFLDKNLISYNENAQHFFEGNYAISFGEAGEAEQEGYHLGDIIEIEGQEFEIAAISDVPIDLDLGTSDFQLRYIISAQRFLELYPDSVGKQLLFNVDPDYQDQAESFLREYTRANPYLSYTSRNTITKAYKESTRTTTVIGQVMGIIIAGIGILNFLNTMYTSIIARKKEFAVMQSIGMTARQLRSMLVLEGIFYGVLSLGVSYILSTLAIITGVKSYAANQFTMTYHFTLNALIFCTPVLLALAVTIPYFCCSKIEKRSLVERLRAEV